MDRELEQTIKEIESRERAAGTKRLRRAGWVLFIVALVWALVAPRVSDAGPLDLFMGPLLLAIFAGFLMAADDISKLLGMLRK